MNYSIYAIFLALALAVAPAYAVVADSSPSMDAVCRAKGFDYGIAKWQYMNNGWQQVGGITGYGTEVSGTQARAKYASVPAADGVLSNGASEVYPGEYGVLVKGENHKGNSNSIFFCGSHEEVPEFSDFLMIGTVGIIGAGIVARKRA